VERMFVPASSVCCCSPCSSPSPPQLNLTNNSNHVAFFVRADITRDPDSLEILPIGYDDNYITIFPRETRTIEALFDTNRLAGGNPALRVEGYNAPKQIAPLAAQPNK
jgi:hypothetical protein